MAIVWRHLPACVQQLSAYSAFQTVIRLPTCVHLFPYVYHLHLQMRVASWGYGMEASFVRLGCFFCFIKVAHHVHSHGRKF